MIRWQKGGEGTLVTLDGDRVAARSTIPSAPGSRLDGVLDGAGALRIKIARCRKQEDGFLLEGRLIDTTREVRAALERTLAADGPA